MKTIKEITDKDILKTKLLSYKKPKISARGILIDEELNIALLHIKNWDAFSLPGGGKQNGESTVDALKREMGEEAGCSIKILGEIGTILENRAYHDFVQISYYYLTKVKVKKNKFKLTKKEIRSGTEVIWLNPEEAYETIKSQKPSKNRYLAEFMKMRDLEIFKYLKKSDDGIPRMFRYITENKL